MYSIPWSPEVSARRLSNVVFSCWTSSQSFLTNSRVRSHSLSPIPPLAAGHPARASTQHRPTVSTTSTHPLAIMLDVCVSAWDNHSIISRDYHTICCFLPEFYCMTRVPICRGLPYDVCSPCNNDMLPFVAILALKQDVCVHLGTRYLCLMTKVQSFGDAILVPCDL